MKVLCIIELSALNAGHYSHELQSFANFVSDNFTKIIIFTPFGFREYFNLNQNIQIISIYKKSHSLNFFVQFYFYLKALKLIRDKNCIIHVWGYRSVLPLFIAQYFSKSKINFITLKAIDRERVSIFRIKILGVFQQFCSLKLMPLLSKNYIVHTDQLRDRAIQIGIKSPIKIQTSVTLTKNTLQKSEARIKLGINPSKTVLLFLGVIREEKGIFEILNLIRKIKTDFTMIIAGENWLRVEIDQLITSNDLHSKVLTRIGYIKEEDKAVFFSATDINLIYRRPAFQGESGLLLDALSFKTPTITHHLHSAAKIILENQIGEIATYNDAIDFDSKINKILSNYDFYVEKINEYVILNSVEKMKSDYLKIYSEK